MRVFTKFSLRFAVYLVVVAYLLGDLYLFDGPIHRKLRASDPNSPEAIAEAKKNGVVARVFNHQITRSQLNYAMSERLWLEGKRREDLSPDALKLFTYAVLGDLIDHELLRVKAKVNTHNLLVSDSEINERLKRFVGKFETKGHLQTAMKAQGIPNEKTLRNRIAARIQQEKYVDLRVSPLITVSEEEITDFYEANKEQLRIPERIRARHIFIATLDKSVEETKQTIDAALADLESKTKDFVTIAKELSDDPATKDQGGDLGWMSKSRLPEDFAEQVFTMEKAEPAIIRTKLGWHLVEVVDREASKTRTLEEMRDEITSALSARKRKQAVEDFRSALRKFEAHKIDIFHDMLPQ
ncbi:peptidylprolyl isomerase [Luteolibacter algae]|uniref:peptidylprolyl isomerase n=1 Tax=Luteolibacter algae TaxID=454151 RepID=A0ABW5D5M1_9BACT